VRNNEFLLIERETYVCPLEESSLSGPIGYLKSKKDDWGSFTEKK
jgi:hypothetical protein